MEVGASEESRGAIRRIAGVCRGRLQSEVHFARKTLTGGHARTAIAQHTEREDGVVRAAARRRSENVHLRSDGVRLCAHRKFPNVCISGYFTAVFEAARLAIDA